MLKSGMWPRRWRTWAAAIVIALPLTVVASLVLATLAGGDADPFQRDEIAILLEDIHENEAMYFAATGLAVAADVLALGVAAILLVLLRDRSRLLATFGFVGILGAAIGGFGTDAGDLVLGVLAQDYVEDGGAGGIPVGDPVVLQGARMTALWSAVFLAIAWTALGGGFLSLGALLRWAPAGAWTPPRWFGDWALFAGFVWWLTWLAAFVDAAFILIVLGLAVTESWAFAFGVWLWRQTPSAE